MCFIIDIMRPSDWEQVRQIYLDGIATGLATFETSVPSFEEWDKTHLSHTRLVVREAERILAWSALSPVSRRQCYAGVAEVSLYVDSAARGRGIGKALLQAVIESSEQNGIWSLYGCPLSDNVASIQMQLACGFRIIGYREKIARLNGVWKDTTITERRSREVGIEGMPKTSQTPPDIDRPSGYA